MSIKATTIIEIAGKPKEHVSETLNRVLELIKTNTNFKLIEHELNEPKTVQDSTQIYSSFGEFEIEFPNMDTLNGFCFDFMPSSIEIIEPEKITIDSGEMNNLLNDTITKLHQYDRVLKTYMIKEKIAKEKEANEKK